MIASGVPTGAYMALVASATRASKPSATDRSSDCRGWRLYDRATLGKIRPIVKKFKIRSLT
jgi:hypothetical protein